MYKNLVSQSIAAGAEECFKRFRDFLCQRVGTYDYSLTGIGWTLHDSSYAVDENTLTDGDWFVAYSPSESGNTDIYMLFTYSTATSWFRPWAHLYWDNVTHIGVASAGSAAGANGNSADTAILWIYGDLDSVTLITKGATLYHGSWCGTSISAMYDNTVAVSAGAISAGAGGVITLDAVPLTWAIGQNIWLRDISGAEKVTLSAISGNTVTADVANSYAAGCKMQADHCVGNQYGDSAIGYNYGVLSHDGSIGGTNAYMGGIDSLAIVVSSVVPDVMNGDYLCSPVFLYDTSPDGYYGLVPNVYFTKSTGKVSGEVWNDRSGNSYRYFDLEANKYMMFLEV